MANLTKEEMQAIINVIDVAVKSERGGYVLAMNCKPIVDKFMAMAAELDASAEQPPAQTKKDK